MKYRNINILLSTAALVVCFSLGYAAKKKNVSPFLGDLSGFKRSKERKSLLVDRHPTKRAINYPKMMFEPVVILQSEHSHYDQLSLEDKAALSDLFRSFAIETFNPIVDISDVPGEGVLNVRCAIRGLKRGNYYMDSGGTKAVPQDSKKPAGTLEVEAIDSVTKERIIALLDEVSPEKLAASEDEEIVPKVSGIFKEWIEMLKNKFQQEKILSNLPK
ncbi:MAG: hypothetical protein KCHDKBKB_01317 [Elusimicrobia bacterium]|nr:hypothetical protein [Elusimicrobiota bacterium]